jgi:phosphate transport system permease protein
VVLGFLAALWFAPLLERHLLTFFVSLVVVPAALLLTLFGWQAVRRLPLGKRVERGREYMVVAPVLVAALAASAWLAPALERACFQGHFKLWLLADVGVRYDLRNGIVIAFALGFAVIPIMFTLIEDALSNVPYTFTAASLALGASRWQTLWRVVLPSASPGIFAAVMIGLGRAVGETMIVLMATGNTPILDWSLFNGMRTLSANIAVEIPEAPVDGTLYRILFFSGVMLFLMTFAVNTAAEVVRQRLRRQFGRY